MAKVLPLRGRAVYCMRALMGLLRFVISEFQGTVAALCYWRPLLGQI